jgi:hypothetical protein
VGLDENEVGDDGAEPAECRGECKLAELLPQIDAQGQLPKIQVALTGLDLLLERHLGCAESNQKNTTNQEWSHNSRPENETAASAA